MFGLKAQVSLLAIAMTVAHPTLADQPSSSEAAAAPLEEQFRDPPAEARPRVWWHWMNGNISKDGIAKDLAWMKQVGIGGAQTFDANIQTPQIVPERLIYMTPEWKDAFRFAASDADRLGLELGIASSPGWSETGGPWVKPEDGLKKVVWSSTLVDGGKPLKGPLPAPPNVTGPFQTLPMQGGVDEILGNAKSTQPPPASLCRYSRAGLPRKRRG